MKNFIEVINTENQKLILNINEIAYFTSLEEYGKKEIDKARETLNSNIYYQTAKLFGGDDYNDEVDKHFDKAEKANCLIKLKHGSDGNYTNLYTMETYDEIKILIENVE